MKTHGILFSAPMVRAILEGRKTQTRRVVTTREPLQFIGGRGEEDDPSNWGWFFDAPDHHGYMVLGRGHDDRHDHGRISIPCPHGDVGDRLWVRETFALLTSHCWDEPGVITKGGGTVAYRASTDESLLVDRWRPSIFMPRWASRLTLEVTEVRLQRLQDISEDDARAEGVDEIVAKAPTARDAFRLLWDSINGKPRPVLDDDGERVLDDDGRPIMDASRSWASNPWVWAVSFRKIEVSNG